MWHEHHDSDHCAGVDRTHAPGEKRSPGDDAAAMQPVAIDAPLGAPLTDGELAKLRDELNRLAVARAAIALPPTARLVTVSAKAWGHSANDFHTATMASPPSSRESES